MPKPAPPQCRMTLAEMADAALARFRADLDAAATAQHPTLTPAEQRGIALLVLAYAISNGRDVDWYRVVLEQAARCRRVLETAPGAEDRAAMYAWLRSVNESQHWWPAFAALIPDGHGLIEMALQVHTSLATVTDMPMDLQMEMSGAVRVACALVAERRG
jgi:hypothetical protein